MDNDLTYIDLISLLEQHDALTRRADALISTIARLEPGVEINTSWDNDPDWLMVKDVLLSHLGLMAYERHKSFADTESSSEGSS